MMNIKILVVVKPPSIYYDCSTRKTFWEEKFTGEEKFTFGEFLAVNTKKYCRRNVRKQKEIKGRDKYVTLYISLKFDSMDKIRITYSESKHSLGRSGKGLITSLGFEAKVRPHK